MSSSLHHIVHLLELASNDEQIRRSLILPPQALSIESPEHRQVLAAFVEDLTKFLDVQPERTSIEDLWDENPPQEARGQALKEFLRQEVCLSAAFRMTPLPC